MNISMRIIHNIKLNMMIMPKRSITLLIMIMMMMMMMLMLMLIII